MTYDLCPIGSVLRCPRTGDLYTRVGDQVGEPGWIALYVDHRTDADRDVRMLPDATEVLATGDLPDRLVLLEPVVVSGPQAAPIVSVAPVVVDLDAAMQALAVHACAVFGVGVA